MCLPLVLLVSSLCCYSADGNIPPSIHSFPRLSYRKRYSWGGEPLESISFQQLGSEIGVHAWGLVGCSPALTSHSTCHVPFFCFRSSSTLCECRKGRVTYCWLMTIVSAYADFCFTVSVCYKEEEISYSWIAGFRNSWICLVLTDWSVFFPCSHLFHIFYLTGLSSLNDGFDIIILFGLKWLALSHTGNSGGFHCAKHLWGTIPARKFNRSNPSVVGRIMSSSLSKMPVS